MQLFVITAILSACATSAPQPTLESSQGTSAAVPDEVVFHEALHWCRNSAEYRAIFEQTYALASIRIEELARGRAPGSWAVSIDADETLVDNSPYQVEVGRRGESFGTESWSRWVHQSAAPALPGAISFTHKIQQMGGVVAVVTNRGTADCEPTAENLRKVGVAYDVVLCRGEDREKEPRWEALEDGTAGAWPGAQTSGDWHQGPVSVLMWLGDNIGDFPNQEQDIRHLEEPLAEFGTRFFVLPNPMYGSWEENPRD